jgi:hypothetical protein
MFIFVLMNASKPNINRNAILFLLLILITGISQGQTVESFDFVGTLVTQDSQLMSYRLKINIQNNDVKGYSLTNIDGPDETKTEVIGTYDYKSKELVFKETKIIYTKSQSQLGDFCFIHSTSSLNLRNKKNILIGNFSGLYQNNDTCALGKVQLLGVGYVMKKLKQVSKVAARMKINDSTKLAMMNPDNFQNKINTNYLNSNETLKYDWEGSTAIIRLWDHGKEDNDMITIKVNGVFVLRQYVIKRAQKEIEVKLKIGDNIIQIFALNDGDVAPNTANVMLVDGLIEHNLVSNLAKSHSAKINLVRN